MIRELRFTVAWEQRTVPSRDNNRYGCESISSWFHPAVDINHLLAIRGDGLVVL